MKKLFKIEESLYKAVQTIAIILLVAMTTLFFIQTMLRFILRYALPWAEELCRYMIIWAVFLESGIGISKGIHVGFDLLASRIHGKAHSVIYIITQIIIMILAVQLILGGYTLTMQVRGQLSASLLISMAWFYSSIIAGGVLLFIFCGFNILREVVGEK